jgi:hypothetical protein
MATFWENRGNRTRRIRDGTERFPEFNGRNFDEIAEIDAFARFGGERPSQMGRDSDQSLARIGLTDEEQKEVEQQARTIGDLDVGQRQLFREGFPEPISSLTPQDIAETRRIDVGPTLTQPVPQPERVDSPEFVAAQRQLSGRAFPERQPGIEEALRATAAFERAGGAPDRPLPDLPLIERVAKAFDKFVEDTIDETARLGQIGFESVQSGENFINLWVNAVTGKTSEDIVGGEGFRIQEQDWYERQPRFFHEVVDAFNVVNFATVGGGLGAGAALRTAAAARTGASAKVLLGLANVVEPFAAKPGAALLGEIGAEVGAIEGVRAAGELTEDAPAPVRLAAQGVGLLAGGVAGGVAGFKGPDILKSAQDLPIGLSIKQVGDGALTVPPVQGPQTALESGRVAILDALKQERTIERLGIRAREVREGRARQFETAQEAGAAAGLRGGDAEDVAAAQFAGLRSERLRQTFAEPVELVEPQRKALVAELQRMLDEGEIDFPTWINAAKGLNNLLTGEGLTPFFLGQTPQKNVANALRRLVGEDVIAAAGTRGRRLTAEQAAIRAAAEDLRAQRQVLLTARQQQRELRTGRTDKPAFGEERATGGTIAEDAQIKALDARIKELEGDLDITTSTGALATLRERRFDVVDDLRRQRARIVSGEQQARLARTGRTDKPAFGEERATGGTIAQDAQIESIDARIKELESDIDITTPTGARAAIRAGVEGDEALRAEELITPGQRARALKTGRAEKPAFDEQAGVASTKLDQLIIDARIKELETDIDITTPTGARAALGEARIRGQADEAARESVNKAVIAARKARNAAEEALIRETRDDNIEGVARLHNARTNFEAKEARKAFNAVEALEQTHPNKQTLMDRFDALMERPLTGTPAGERVIGESGKPTGARGETPSPRVPREIRDDVRKTIELWLEGTEARLAHEVVESGPLIRTIDAQILGKLDSPVLTHAVYRRTLLEQVFVKQGLERKIAADLADTMMQQQLGLRLGESYLAIREGRKVARGQIRKQQRAATGLQAVPDDDEFKALVDQKLREQFGEKFGLAAVAQEKSINDQLALLKTPEGLKAFRDIVQRHKNTMFGAFDVGVLGIQLPTAINRGGIPLMAKMVNDALAVMKLPNARNIYTDGFLPKQIQAALAGVDQSARQADFQADVGTIFEYGSKLGLPGAGTIDRSLMASGEAMSEIQFGTILGAVRNAAFEGNLSILHLTGQIAKKFNIPGNFDITDPLVQQTAAAFANNIGSTAMPALRGGRKSGEQILATSSLMTRARFNNITLMAKVFTRKSTAAERMMAATMISSQMFYAMVIGSAINEMVGLTVYEMDPSKGGYGLITVSDGEGGTRIIDTIPQDSTTRAFARSIREIKEQGVDGLDEAAFAWAKVYLGSSSNVGKIPTGLMGYGFEPGRGFTDDLSRSRAFADVFLPIPPIFQQLNEEGFEAMGTGLEAAGVGNFPEGAYGHGNRVLEQAGLDPDELNSRERRSALDDLGVLHDIEIQSQEELEARDDHEASALLLRYEKRDEKQRIYDEEVDGGTKSQYRNRTRDVNKIFIGKNSEFEDVWRSFGESEDETTRIAGMRYELIDQATTGTEVDFDVLEELQARFDADLDPTVREAVYAFVESIDPLANPWEQELDLLNLEIADSGWYDLRDAEWIDRGFAEATGFATEREAADEFITRIEAEAKAAGLSDGRALEEAREGWQQTDTKKSFSDALSLLREEWVTNSPKNVELMDQMLEWGIVNSVSIDIEQYIDAVLAE